MVLFIINGIFLFIFCLVMLLLSIYFMLFNLEFFLEWSLIILNSSMMSMLIYMDWISLMFMFTVMLISSMIMFYCVEYMSHELNKIRFFYLMLFFIISMILMIMSPSMISIILGWDGLGLTSYGLVIFYQNYFSYNSGMLTILMNRVGDIMIMLSISILMILGNWNFMNFNFNFENFFLLFFLTLASFTKSAQLPFSSWLPAAMAAPTPVSSLVHSSTLVTAGIYLLIRFNFLIYKNSKILFFILSIGLITMLMAGISANFEFDFKKIIAFSTLSQLGLMMMIYSMKFFILSYFHLIIHAMFKSMMFMCSGIIIHSMMNFQDIRYMGNLMNFLPLTFIIIFISNMSLCGMPFFSGFYSKDLILEKIFMSNFFLILFILLIFGTLLTVIYSIRLMYYLLNKNFNFFSMFKLNDFKLMNFSLFFMLINSIFMGYMLNFLIFLNIEDIYLMKFEKLMILMICLISIIVGKMFFISKFKFNYLFMYMYGKMFFLNFMNFYMNNFLMLMKNYYFLIDKGLEIFSENLITEILKFLNLKIFSKINLLNLMLSTSLLILFFMLI
uniref:NADH dehydrogenase subunit 5 n=1 Tax=Ooencyrtus plautus TaxID=2989845 RepID=UPI002238B287|nr:NADH dehydrogenase subunit 5 [Ooencyrtus plautus]UYP50995.1 NADH dehydrogenase subunit 5 [Ooencyrtus plautus]